MKRLFNHQTIDEFLLDITETAEYKSIERVNALGIGLFTLFQRDYEEKSVNNNLL